MNILVTGANGQLGISLRRCVEACPGVDTYLFTDVAELDITDRAAVEDFVHAHAIDLIVNCAAYTDVERAEDNEALAERINAEAVRHLAEAIRSREGTLFHVSTDYVFGGNFHNTPCTETENPNPIGAYGRTKLHGEQAILDSGCHAIILRTAWLYSPFGKNFFLTMQRLTRERQDLRVVTDQIGTPTYAADLAAAIHTLIADRRFDNHYGIYHYSNEGTASWYDFAWQIARLSGNNSDNISPCLSADYPSRVERPKYSVLDKTKFKNTFGLSVPYWIEALERCVASQRDAR